MPHCIGAIDVKHIRIQCPKNTCTLFHNYKGFFSLVQLAVCDAKYRFTLVDAGAYGSNNSQGRALTVFFLVGDEIFSLKPWLMRPISGNKLVDERSKVFNYRHSRARRVIENAFGILVARWRIFRAPIEATPGKVVNYVLHEHSLAQLFTSDKYSCIFSYWICRFIRFNRYNEGR